MEHAPEAETELLYDNPFQLLVAVILSAQCTDKRVNITTPFIFAKYPDAKTMSKATIMQLFALIKSVSFPNNKAKHLVGMAKMLCEKFNGIVPGDVDQLLLLPGVGRKTANVIASVVYNQPTMAVDTHVFRVAARIGLTLKAKTPFAAEQQLVKYFHEEKIPLAHHWLILHGRYVCLARNPKCNECGITAACNYFKKNMGKLMRNAVT